MVKSTSYFILVIKLGKRRVTSFIAEKNTLEKHQIQVKIALTFITNKYWKFM